MPRRKTTTYNKVWNNFRISLHICERMKVLKHNIHYVYYFFSRNITHKALYRASNTDQITTKGKLFKDLWHSFQNENIMSKQTVKPFSFWKENFFNRIGTTTVLYKQRLALRDFWHVQSPIWLSKLSSNWNN